jgi:hypothetical protein
MAAGQQHPAFCYQHASPVPSHLTLPAAAVLQSVLFVQEWCAAGGSDGSRPATNSLLLPSFNTRTKRMSCYPAAVLPLVVVQECYAAGGNDDTLPAATVLWR